MKYMSESTQAAERSEEVTGHDLQKAIDDLFSVRKGKWLPGRLCDAVETRTYGDWDAKDDASAPIKQRLDLLERPFDPSVDPNLESVPGFTIERTIWFAGPTIHEPLPLYNTSYEFFINDGFRHEFIFDQDGTVAETYYGFNPEHPQANKHGIVDGSVDLNNEEIAEWHRKLSSPSLMHYELAREEFERQAKKSKVARFLGRVQKLFHTRPL